MFLYYISAILRILRAPTQSEQLKKYIESHNPSDITDIERLAVNWHRGGSRGSWL
jgi:hypothetical protein